LAKQQKNVTAPLNVYLAKLKMNNNFSICKL